MILTRLGGRQHPRGRRGAERKLCLGHAGQRDGRIRHPRRSRMHQMQRGPRRGQRRAGAARQRAADAADHQRAHRGHVAEPQLGLRRMHVHVQLVRRQVEPQRHHRMASHGDHVAIGDAHRALQHRIGDRPAVDRQRLRRRGGAGDRRRAGEAGDAQRPAFARHRDHRLRRLRAEQRRDALGAVLPRQVERDAAVAFQPERHLGRGQRQAAHRGLGVVRLGARMLEELAPRRGGEEQVAHHHARPHGAGGGRDIRDRAALDADLRGVRRTGRARGDGEPRRGADRGQRLAAEAQGGDVHQVVVGQLRGGVAQHRQRQAVRVHAAAVVGHLDAVDAAGVERHRDPRRTRVERVLHQLLHRRRRALDHLAGGDAIDGVGRQDADRRQCAQACTKRASV